MATKYSKLLFKCELLASDNSKIEQYSFDIEYLDVFNQKWETFQREIETKNGAMNFSYEIPSRIPKTEITPRIIREAVASGSIPMFRVVETCSDEVRIISQAPEILFDDKTESITINFRKVWLLENSMLLKEEEATIIASPVFVGSLSKDQLALEEENARLENKIEEGKLEFEKAKEDFARHANEFKKSIEEQRNTAKIAERLLEEKATEISDLKEKLRASTSNDNTKLIEELQLQLKAKTFEVEELGKQQLLLQEENKNTRIELEKARTDVTMHQNTIDDLVRKVKASQNTVIEKNFEIKTLTQNVAIKSHEISDLKEQVKEVSDYIKDEHPNKLVAKKVYSSIINDIAIADEEMINSRFKLANISMNLKATVEKGPHGTVLGLLDFESAKEINGAAISDISIDIVPNQNSMRNENKVPNIIGLTETAARKVLVDYGLKLDVIYQPTKDPKFIEGQAIKQAPVAGGNLIAGQEVIVIFAKPLKN